MPGLLGNRYRLVREMGAGGMGRVFMATDTVTGGTVAAKVLVASSSDDFHALLRFQQEGAVLSTLKHPNIVEVYGTFLEVENQTSCIIMELLEGTSLAQVLRTQRLSLERVKGIMSQVAHALAYAHGRAIVHRDIKPDNIMVLSHDQVKVTDFGIARILRSGATLNTATGMSIGTPLYMAPEQIEGQKVDGRADVYSFGAVLYQLVTGRPPFEGDDPLTVAFKHVHKAPQPPHEVNAAVPADWEGVILKCLAKDPAERYQTAAALAEAVTQLSLPTLTEPAEPEAAPPPAPAPAPTPAPTILPPAQPPTPPPAATLPPAAAAPPVEMQPAPAVEPSPAAQSAPPPVEQPDASPIPTPPPTIIRPPAEPVVNQTVIRPDEPRPAPAGQTVLRPAAEPAPQPVAESPVRQTMSQAQPPAVALEAPAVSPERKRPRPVLPIAGGVVVLLGAVAAVLFFVLGSPSHKASSNPSTPVPKVSLAPTLHTSGTTNAVSGGSVRLAWGTVAGATRYHLQVARAATDPSDTTVFKHVLRSVVTARTSYRVRVIGYQFYYWRVQARVGGKWGKYSPSSHFAVPKPVVGKPRPLSPRDGTSRVTTRIELCWTGVKGAADYALRINGLQRIVRGTCTWVSVRAQHYRWSVAARAKGVRLYAGPRSSMASFTIKAKPRAKPRPTPRPQPTATPQPVVQQPTQPPVVQPTSPPPVQVQPTSPPAYVAPTPVPYQPPPPQPTKAPACNPC